MTELVVSLLDAPLTRSLLRSQAWPAPLSVDVRAAASVDANSRAMQRLEFDVAEMSFATFLRARLVDDVPLVALPVFTGRRFLQPLVGVLPGSHITSPGELSGARVVVPQYWMTSSVWHRAVLHDHYGVAPSSLTWLTTADERFSSAPSGITVHRCSGERAPVQVLADGDADALLAPRPPADPAVCLFPKVDEEQQRYHGTSGVFPIMHLVVVRSDVLAAAPGAVAALWQAFLGARQAVWPEPPVPSLSDVAAAETFQADPWSYGVQANAASLQALLGWVRRDGLVPYEPDPSDIFVPESVLS